MTQGRHAGPEDNVRRNRNNLMLDDREQEVFDLWLQKLGEKYGLEKPLDGSKLLRRVFEPMLRRHADLFGVELYPSKRSDFKGSIRVQKEKK